MSGKTNITVSGGAVLLFAILWFFLEPLTFFALLLAALFHELGHLSAMVLFGCRIKAIKANATGALIIGGGGLTVGEEVCCLAAGPLFGILFAFTASILGSVFESGLLLRSSGISIVLSVFNLLPVYPLDGGRLMLVLCKDKRTGESLSFASALFVLGSGLLLMAKGMGAGLFIAGIWLMLEQAVL